MTVTISSDKISAGSSKMLPLGYNQSILATAAVPATTGANDIYQMIKLESNPSGYANDGAGGPTILGVDLGADSLDAASSLTLDVGDTTTAAKYFSQSTVGQSPGARAGSTLVGVLGYQPFASPFFHTYTTVSLATYLMQIKVHTSAATALAGNIRLLCSFTVDP